MANKFVLNPISYMPNLRIMAKRSYDGKFFGVSGNRKIVEIDDNGDIVKTYGTVGFDIYGMLILHSGTMLLRNSSGTPHIYRSNDLNYNNFSIVYSAGTGRQPLERGWDKNNNDLVLMGEYIINEPRTSYPDCDLLRATNDGRDWEIIKRFKRFPQHQNDTEYIRHLHTVCYDPYEDAFWVGSGDTDTESKVYKTTNGDSLELIGTGNQMWRSVSFEFWEDYVVWGSDATDVQNYMVRYNRNTKELDQMMEIAGPVYISKRLETSWGDIILNSTAVEGSAAEWDNLSHHYMNHDGVGEEWFDVLTWEKNTNTSLRPRIYFVESNGRDKILLSQRNIKIDETTGFEDYVLIVVQVTPQSFGVLNDSKLVVNVSGEIYEVDAYINKGGSIERVNSVAKI